MFHHERQQGFASVTFYLVDTLDTQSDTALHKECVPCTIMYLLVLMIVLVFFLFVLLCSTLVVTFQYRFARNGT